MELGQILILVILLAAIVMFIWGRWRHDMVAVGALLACVLAGLVPAADAFAGFGHPAVITVACILVLSRGLQTSGAVDVLTRKVLPSSGSASFNIAVLTILAAVLSAFMNNVGALALLMPVAMAMATRLELAPGQVLMPLAFGSILGGMTTLIGTPPNLIVSGFRREAGLGTFAMFDFTAVGLAVTVAGIVVILLLGRRLIPVRDRAGAEDFNTGHYLTEARVGDESRAAGLTIRAAEALIEDDDAHIVAMVRDEQRINAPHGNRKLRAGDILVIEADPKALLIALQALDVRLAEDTRGESSDPTPAAGPALTTSEAVTHREPADAAPGGEAADSDEKGVDVGLLEVVVMPTASLIGRSARGLKLRSRLGINLLAVSRQGSRTVARLRSLLFRPGDVLLMQGPLDSLHEFAVNNGCVPLADRSLRLPRPREALIASGILLVAVIAAAFGLFPAAVAFAAGALVAMATNVVPPRKVYEAVDWPVIVLLGALIPVAGAMATTGTADLMAGLMLTHFSAGSAVIGLVLVLVITMSLSDFMNNAATAAVMCPIAISAANTLGVSADPFLMAVAVGASCAFLTPIGHQNNTLILGPGGFRFGDYWRLGLPLEVVVVAVATPMILLVWPF